jgi:hypothetical protein
LPFIFADCPEQQYTPYHFTLDDMEDYPQLREKRRENLTDAALVATAAKEPVLYLQDPGLLIQSILYKYWDYFYWKPVKLERARADGSKQRAYGHFITGDKYVECR